MLWKWLKWLITHPLIDAIAAVVIGGLILRWLSPSTLQAILARLAYPVSVPLLGLVVLVGLLFLFVVLYLRERRKNRSHWQPHTGLVSNDDILWEYSDDLQTDGGGLEIEKAICPNPECRNVLDMPEWKSYEAPVFGIKATCKKCGFSKSYPLYHLDGLKLLAKREVERLRRLKQTPWQKLKKWIKSK